MKKYVFLFCYILFFSCLASATVELKGVVCDGKTLEGIPYATLSISMTTDSTHFIKRFASDVDGAFKESFPSTGEYLLTITSIGYDNYYQRFVLKGGSSEFNFGQLKLQESSDSLAEVVLVAQKPLVKVDLDKLSYDIENDPDAQKNTTLEMLRKVPMVSVDGEDNIQVKGSSNFKIYINGKPSNIVAKSPSQALKSIPASTIKSIEVITEPGAKYDAEGLGGVINIVTKHSLVGCVGSVRAGVNIFGSPNLGFYISSKIGKFGITANLNYGSDFNPGFNSSSERVMRDTLVSQYLVRQDARGKNRSHYGYGSIEASYEIDSLDLLSLSFSGNLGANRSKSQGISVIENYAQDTLVRYDNRDNTYNFWSGLNLSLDYQRMFKKPQQLLTFSYQWDMMPNRQQSMTHVDGVKNYLDYDQQNSSKANGNEHTFQIDYVEPFDSGRHTMEFGMKYILRDNHSTNNYLLYDSMAHEWSDLPFQNNRLLNHMQHILSGYGSYSFRYKAFSLRAGARFEYTSQYVTTDTSFSTNYFNIVPNVVLGYQLGMTSNIRLTYTQRLQRPGIFYLNPYYDNSNPFSVQQGNPELKPTLSHSISASYGFFSTKLNLNTSLDFSYTDNSIQSIVSNLNDSVLYTSYYNIGKELRTGLSLYLQWTIVQGVMLYTNGYLSYSMLSTEQFEGAKLERDGFNFYINGGGQFMLPWQLRLGVYGGYFAPSIMLQGKGSDYYYYGLSLSRNFLKDKLSVSLDANNFASFKHHFNSFIQTNTYVYNSDFQYSVGRIGLTVSYNFGQMREQIKKVSRGIENDDVMGGSGGTSGGTSQSSGVPSK